MITQDTAMPSSPAERLEGGVERVTFHSLDSGFCVLRVKVRGQRELVTVVGIAVTVSPGEYVECAGWITRVSLATAKGGKPDRLRPLPKSELLPSRRILLSLSPWVYTENHHGGDIHPFATIGFQALGLS